MEQVETVHRTSPDTLNSVSVRIDAKQAIKVGQNAGAHSQTQVERSKPRIPQLPRPIATQGANARKVIGLPAGKLRVLLQRLKLPNHLPERGLGPREDRLNAARTTFVLELCAEPDALTSLPRSGISG